MLLSFDETVKKIASGQLLHIAGAEKLLKKLPCGNWLGGSTEYFMAKEGGIVTDDLLYVNEFAYNEYIITTYDADTIPSIMSDAFDNGFTLIILPFDSAVHNIYAAQAPEFLGMFIKNIAGWVSGVNADKKGQVPLTINGQTGIAYENMAVAVHIRIPDDKLVNIGIINIFKPNKNSPVLEFAQEGFSVQTCLADGKEVVLANFLKQNAIDTKLPLIGDYSGAAINTAFKSVENDVVEFYAPVFPHIKYNFSEPIEDYIKEFNERLSEFTNVEAIFACNCILNFLYGDLAGKDISTFFGPVTFGEVAYQLLNQTLVYVTVT
ncbi:MAG: hypothetical protein FWG61_05800 [Firmicutes bacterium]|nr:hypothetical protein [Bacillota bacterium]